MKLKNFLFFRSGYFDCLSCNSPFNHEKNAGKFEIHHQNKLSYEHVIRMFNFFILLERIFQII